MKASHIIQATGIGKNFGGVVALHNLDFTIRENNITAIIGPNGAGKSTLIDIMSCFTPPSRGTITYKGNRITGLKNHEIVPLGIARTFQHVQIFENMTVLENVMVGRHTKSDIGLFRSGLRLPGTGKKETEIRDQARHFLDIVGLQESADLPAESITIGKQRMLEIARALATEPEVLLLDEPAAGLNTQETRALGELIQKIKQSRITIVIIEHDMELVMDISDEIMVINFGEKIAWGTPSEIQADPEVIKVYLGEEKQATNA